MRVLKLNSRKLRKNDSFKLPRDSRLFRVKRVCLGVVIYVDQANLTAELRLPRVWWDSVTVYKVD